jgi:hypothetical protein
VPEMQVWKLRIDLYDKIPGTTNFNWYEFLWLNQFKFFVLPGDDQAQNIINIMKKLQWIRDYFKKPTTITSGIRPAIYNAHIGGVTNSAHINGEAVDFVIKGLDCDFVRSKIEPFLDVLQIRCENKPGSSWVHIDSKPPGRSGRFFIP